MHSKGGNTRGLFRRGRINDSTLDQQLDMIDAETAGLQAGIEQAARALSADDQAAQLQSAEALLATLRKRLAGPVSPDLKRRIIEILVEKVQADTGAVGRPAERTHDFVSLQSAERTIRARAAADGQD